MSTFLERLNTKAAGQTGRRKQHTELRAAHVDASQKRAAARVAVRSARKASGAGKTAARAAAAPIVLAARQACKTASDKAKALLAPLPA